MAQHRHSYSRKQKDLGIESKDRDKTRLTSTRTNTNPAASCPASEAHKGVILLQIIQSHSTPALPHTHTPHFASFHSVCSFLGQTSYDPSISNIPGSPQKLGLCLYSFTH